MNKKYCFLSILFFIPFLSLAQTKKDSLRNELKRINIDQIKPTDSAVFELLNSLSTVYKNENPDSSIYYANTILYILRDEKNDQARLNAHTRLTQAYYIKSNSTEAFAHANKSLEYAKNLNDLSAQLYAINGLGLVYLLQNKLPESIRTFDKSLVLAQEIGDEMRVAISYFNKSIAYDEMKSYDSAMVNVNKAITLSRKNDYREKWSMALNRKGVILSNLNKFDQSIIAHEEAIDLIEASNKWELCFAYAGLSKAYNGTNNFNKAVFYGKESLKIAQSLGAKWDIFHSANILSETYEKQGNYKEAFNYYKIYKTYNDSIFTEKSETKLATLRLEQSNKEKEEFQLKNQLQAEVISQQRYQLALIILAISILAILLVYIFINAKYKKKVASQVKEQRDELEQLNISKDKILSVLAHDMRSPINSILGLLYLVKHSNE